MIIAAAPLVKRGAGGGYLKPSAKFDVMIKAAAPYIKITRPVNTAITGCAVALGIWAAVPGYIGANPAAAALLAAAAMAAAAYGNVINDILDVKSDRVSHPNRPLANGAMNARPAAAFALILAAASLACAAAVSAFHLAAAAAPLILLTLYSIYFKRTRIMGNIIVASLVAYALLFGALPHPNTKILILPATLAFLLNFCRELIKDVEDAEGDKAAGWRTSAALPAGVIKAMLAAAAAAYMAAVLAPSLILGHFGAAYTIVCLAAVVPLHIFWMMLVLKPEISKNAKKAGTALKLEMAAGMIALALDRAINYFIG